MWTARADDTQIFGGSTISLPPNVLIIFDNSGSMAENVWVEGSDEEYDKNTVYTGSYSRRYVYRERNGAWEQFADIGTNYVVDSGEISCTEAREALNEYGHWIGQISGTGTHPCGTSYTSKNLRTGNYLNYTRLTLPHWEQKISVAKRTIANLIRTTTGVRFGVMVFNYSEGGHLLAPVADRETSTEKEALIAQINALSASTWTPLAETLAEAGLYFARKESWFNAGVNYATDYTPVIQYRCQKNYIVIMTDGESTQDRNSKLWDTEYINGKTIGDYDNDSSLHDEYHWVDTSGTHAYSDNGSDYLDDVAKFLYDEDLMGDVDDTAGVSFNSEDYPKQNIITYTIGFNIDHKLLTETADSEHGQGDYFTTSGSISLQDIFERIIGSILETNSQFISPVVPVNRINRTYADNALYIGIFSPDASTPGLWKGNLKKFGLSKQGVVLDRHGVDATTSSGAIKEGAHSVWGPEVQGTEGMTVDRGGAGTVLKDDTTRTFLVNSGASMVALDTTNVSAADLGLSTDAQRDDLLNFVKAQGIYAPSYSGADSKARSWILGDIIHSQPAVFYDATNQKNILFVGTNHGFLHCFADNDQGTSDDLSDDSVEELWAFTPQDLLPNLKYLPSEGATVHIPGNSDHEYFVDGSPAVYRSSENNNVYLAFGLRRGGKDLSSGGELANQYFILNITNYANPTFVTSISRNILGSGASDEPLGQSWSTPHFCSIKTGTTTKKEVLLLAGGYDTNQDQDNPGSADSKGRAVFAVDAKTGSLVSSLNFNHANYSKMRYCMVDLRSYDHNDDGCEDVIYAPSAGGDLFVFDDRTEAAGSPYDGTWSKRLLFSAQNRGSTAKLRKFLYAPGVAQETWGDWVYIGSGDREHPNEKTGDETSPSPKTYNRFYAIRNTWPATWNDDDPLTDSDLTDITDDSLQGTASTPSSLTDAQKAALRASLSTSGNGWFFDLEHPGEKVVSTPLVYNRVVYFTTYTPSSVETSSSSDPCYTGAGAGTARIYAVDFRTGEAVFQNFDGNPNALTKEDRYKDIGSGIPSEPTLVITEQGAFIIVGTQEGPIQHNTAERRSIHPYYWLKTSS